jgi:hypothetical protein
MERTRRVTWVLKLKFHGKGPMGQSEDSLPRYWMISKKVERECKKLRRKGCGKKEGTGDFMFIHWHKIEMVLEDN